MFGRIQEALIQGRDDDLRTLVQEAIASGTSAGDLLKSGLIPAMETVGDMFGAREIFLPDVLLAARAMNAGVDILKPHLEESEVSSKGTIVLGTVEGDLHDIGKNLVGIMLRGAGYEVVDLGNDVGPAAFVAAAKEHRPLAVGMSALLTTTMPAMSRVITALRKNGLSGVKVVVGGAALSEAYAREIGADEYGYDAARAVEILRSWTP